MLHLTPTRSVVIVLAALAALSFAPAANATGISLLGINADVDANVGLLGSNGSGSLADVNANVNLGVGVLAPAPAAPAPAPATPAPATPAPATPAPATPAPIVGVIANVTPTIAVGNLGTGLGSGSGSGSGGGTGSTGGAGSSGGSGGTGGGGGTGNLVDIGANVNANAAIGNQNGNLLGSTVALGTTANVGVAGGSLVDVKANICAGVSILAPTPTCPQGANTVTPVTPTPDTPNDTTPTTTGTTPITSATGGGFTINTADYEPSAVDSAADGAAGGTTDGTSASNGASTGALASLASSATLPFTGAELVRMVLLAALLLAIGALLWSYALRGGRIGGSTSPA